MPCSHQGDLTMNAATSLLLTRTHPPRTGRLAGLIALGLALSGSGTARAQTRYTIHPIVKRGDRAGDVTIRTLGGSFKVGGLNDDGQLTFVAENEAGGQALIQYRGSELIPIVAGAT